MISLSCLSDKKSFLMLNISENMLEISLFCQRHNSLKRQLFECNTNKKQPVFLKNLKSFFELPQLLIHNFHPSLLLNSALPFEHF